MSLRTGAVSINTWVINTGSIGPILFDDVALTKNLLFATYHGPITSITLRGTTGAAFRVLGSLTVKSQDTYVSCCHFHDFLIGKRTDSPFRFRFGKSIL